MLHAQFSDLLQIGGKPVEQAVLLERAHSLELGVRSTARADDVRVVGVRKPVRAGSRAGDDDMLIERQRCVARSRRGEQVGDRLSALGIDGRVSGSLGVAFKRRLLELERARL